MGREASGGPTSGGRNATRNESAASERKEELPTRGGIDVFDSLLVRQPIRPGETGAVLELLEDRARTRGDGDARTLLPVEGVTLVTLFLDRGEDAPGDDTDALLWYVEVVDDDRAAWADPDATLRTASPVFAGGLADLLAPTGTVHADGRSGHQLVTHATHPRRQQRYAEHCGPPFVAPVAGDELPIPVAVATVPIKPGIPSWLVGRVVALGNWCKRFDRVSGWLRDQTDTLEAEAMYTESLLLEPVDGQLVLHYYMETEDMERLYDAYEASDNWDVRFSDWAMRRIFEDPEDVLEKPLESDCEVLVHAVHPDRP